MKAWIYTEINCGVCGADIPIHGAKGNMIHPRHHKRRKSCNNPVCQNTLRHPPSKKLTPKPCKECDKPIPTIWPRGEQKNKSQYDKLQYCSPACKIDDMFLPIPLNHGNHTAMDFFIYCGQNRAFISAIAYPNFAAMTRLNIKVADLEILK